MSEFKLFIEAIKVGSLELYDKYYKIEYLNRKDENMSHPIHHACDMGQKQILKQLIDKNCDIEARDNYDCRPIHLACDKGYTKIVKLLIEKNCDIEAQNIYNCRPIHLACDKGHIKIVKLLIEKNCDIEAHNIHNCKPIHFACDKGHIKIVKLLIEKNCDIEASDMYSWRPIHHACDNGHTEILKMLIGQNCNIEAQEENYWRPIHNACHKGHIEIVRLLINKNCDFDARDIENCRPIHFACENGHTEIVKLLTKAECNIDGITEKMEKCSWQSEEINKILNGRKLLLACKNWIKINVTSLLNNADIEYKDKDNRRPIHWACLNGHIKIVKLLIGKNCNIECCDNDNRRPIHLVCQNGYIEIVKVLIERNCSIDCCDNDNRRPIHWACLNGHIEIVKLLIGKNCNIECCDNDNRRPIHWACQNGHNEIVNTLIERNCNIDVIDNFNVSSMEIVEYHNNEELKKILRAKILNRQISMMGLECTFSCDHKLCPKSLRDKTFDKGSKIGKGSFGKVYKCKGSGIDRDFAIKRINSEKLDRRSIERNIYKFLPALNHERIVQYFGVIETDKYFCIFMEFIPDGTIEDKIKNPESLKFAMIIKYSKQILEGLEFLHGNKIIHRDLKPANILMNHDNIKLADFGISRSLINTVGKSTNAHTFVGTLNFMSPEIINNEPYNVSTDIWSVGATVINMITGKPPYHDYELPFLIFQIGSTKKLKLPPIMSDEMKIFIEDMLNIDPNKRPTAAELLKYKLFSQ